MNYTIPIGRRLRQILTVGLVFGSLLCMFPPEIPLVRLWSAYAQLVVLLYLGLATVFLIGKQERLMFVCLGCCAAMAYYLNESTNSGLIKTTVTDAPRLTIAHFNVGASGENYRAMVDIIQARKADLVSCQEVNLTWDTVLLRGLRETYPYSVSLPDFSGNGLAVYSKMPFLKLDTFYFNDLPNLAGNIRLPGSDTTFSFVSSVTRPTFGSEKFDVLREHLRLVSFEANKMATPVFAFGEFNAPPWSAEILDFKSATRLNDSRKPLQTTIPNGYFQLLRVPVDHIFFSNEFECLNFEELSSNKTWHLGILGVFQLKQPAQNVEKTPR